MSNVNRRDFVKTAVVSTAVSAAVAPVIALAEDDKKKEVRLRMQTYRSKEESGDIFKNFTKNVAIASGNSLKIKCFSGGGLVPDAEMFYALTKGTLDMCQGYGGYWPEKLDIANLEGGIVGAWITSDEADYIYRNGLLDAARESYAEHNIHYIAPIYGAQYDLLTKKPVKTLKDLRKLKIRATSSTAQFLKELEIQSVFVPGSGLYDALSTGEIDGVIYGGPMEYTELKLFEVAKHYTKLNTLYPGYADCMLVNKDKWESLTDAQRKVLEVATATHADACQSWLGAGGFEEKYTKNFDFHTLPAVYSAKLHEAARYVWLEEAKKSERNKKVVELLELVAGKR